MTGQQDEFDIDLVEPLTEQEQKILALLVERYSNREIAQRLFLSINTVKWYNQQLFSKLGVSNRKQAVAEAEKRGLLISAAQLPVRPAHNLPADVTPFIGRKSTLQEISSLLENPAHRLISLVGAGGMGKTRLVIQAARSQVVNYSDGVYFVQLAPLSEPKQIVSAIASVLDLQLHARKQPETQLFDHLSRKSLLLVLDNFEHLLAGVNLVGDILHAAANVRVIATSREVLRLDGEMIYDVVGMDLPDTGMEQSEAYSSAVQLFVNSVPMAYGPDEKELKTIAQICRQVGGMPLAIKLAAGLVRYNSVGGISDELASSLDTLETPASNVDARHRSIRVMFDLWWHRLPRTEQDIANRLSVFRGGFSREGAGEIVGVTSRVLKSLVDKSLVERRADGRFQLHELVRQYAAEKLAEGETTNIIRYQHAKFFFSIAESGFKENSFYDPTPSTERFTELAIERDNIQAALGWAYDNRQTEFGLRFVWGMYEYWRLFGPVAEGQFWTEHFIELAANEISPALGRALVGLAGFLYFQARFDELLVSAGRLLDLAGKLGDWQLEYHALFRQGAAYQHLGEFSTAETLLQRALRVAQTANHGYSIASTLNRLGLLAWSMQDFRLAVDYFNQTLSINYEQALISESIYTANLGFVSIHLDEIEQAADYFRISFQNRKMFSALISEGVSFVIVATGLASIFHRLGNPQKATQMLAVVAATLQSTNGYLEPNKDREYDEILTDVRATLSSEAFETAWEQGQAILIEEAISTAFETLTAQSD